MVGDKTASLTKGGCRYCSKYVSPLYGTPHCFGYGTIGHRSFIEYECQMALKDFNAGFIKKLVVIYNGCLSPIYSRCPLIDKKHREAY